jgi:hypothetical protein
VTISDKVGDTCDEGSLEDFFMEKLVVLNL